MNIGLMLLYENWGENYIKAFANQQELVRLSEVLGFDEIWITEHHFNKFSLSSSILTLLSYIVANTTKIKVGSASILTPIYNPIVIAEAIATLNILSKNRFYFGVAKGGPFKKQNELFNLENSREKMLEGLSEILYHLSEESSVYPKPIGEIPTFIASKDDSSIEYAVKKEIGLMSAHLWSNEIVQNSIKKYKSLHPEKKAPKMMCSRGFYVAKTKEEAINEALPALKRFREAMEAQGITNPMFYNEEYWINNGIIGDVDSCIKKVLELKKIGVSNLALKPISNDLNKNKMALKTFSQKVLPEVR